MTIRDCAPGCDEHYGCRLRGKGLQVSPRVNMERSNQNWVAEKKDPPAHYSQVITNDRPGGIRMPLMDPKTGAVIRGKRYEEQKHTIDATIRRIRSTAGA